MKTIGLKKGTVKLLPHNKKWKVIFEKEKKFLLDKLGKDFIAIEHIGSTSITGIYAKPIIDIDAGVRSTKVFKKLVSSLEVLGYKQVKNKSAPNVHLVFAKGQKGLTHFYLHTVKYKGVIWNNDIFFRDYLNKHKQVARTYEKLKTKLTKRFADNRLQYTKAKQQFIKKIVAKQR